MLRLMVALVPPFREHLAVGPNSSIRSSSVSSPNYSSGSILNADVQNDNQDLDDDIYTKDDLAKAEVINITTLYIDNPD
jgi:hypothetical protein